MGKWRNSSPLKKVWTPAEEQFLLDNWQTKNSYQLSSELGVTRTLVRTKLYEMGFEKRPLGTTAPFYLQVQNIFKCKIVIRLLELVLIVAQMHK